MSHGIRIWDAAGNIRLYDSNLILKRYASVVLGVYPLIGGFQVSVPAMPISDWLAFASIYDPTNYYPYGPNRTFLGELQTNGGRSVVYVPNIGIVGTVYISFVGT